MNRRVLAVERYMRSLNSGERLASIRVADHLADDVVLDSPSQPGQPVGREQFEGRDAVLERISGLWPATPGYRRAGWSDPHADGDQLRVTGTNKVELTFSFDEDDRIEHVHVEGGWSGSRFQEIERIPDEARPLINNALADERPVVVTYVDEHGRPRSSLRGSVCVYGDRQLAIWLRHGDGGLPVAIQSNPHVSLVYSDRRSRTLIIIEGRAHVERDEEVRRRVFELTPEVEQTHDPDQHGEALLIDVTRYQGGPGPAGGSGIPRMVLEA